MTNPILYRLREEQAARLNGGLYHRTQVDMTYNSNHIEGSRLTHEQTRLIFETNTIGLAEAANVDDILETTNHFRAIDTIIRTAEEPLTELYIKHLHALLKQGTSDSDKDWFAVGDYKRFPNEVGSNDTTAPEQVAVAVQQLLAEYENKEAEFPTSLTEINKLDKLLDFHVRFERIHPFQDGNGRVGRLLLFKECLRHNIVPFIITDDLKFFYYRGLQEWGHTNGYLRDTCLTAQDNYKKLLDYFRIDYQL